MRDIYMYEDCDVLKNLLNIKDAKLLNDAEADYVTYRLKGIPEPRSQSVMLKSTYPLT